MNYIYHQILKGWAGDTEYCNITEKRLYSYSTIYGWFSSWITLEN